jgi:3-oxoacyl-[acyl-carrier protein] reductase
VKPTSWCRSSRRPRREAKADVSNAEAVRGLFAKAEKALGGIAVLVNNAGIMQLATIAEADDACYFDRHIP